MKNIKLIVKSKVG